MTPDTRENLLDLTFALEDARLKLRDAGRLLDGLKPALPADPLAVAQAECEIALADVHTREALRRLALRIAEARGQAISP